MWTPDQFWANVDERGADECWPWLAGRQTNGHGKVMWGKKVVGAHQVAYELTYGPRDPQLCVLHARTCSTRLCCNPAHLRQGTKAENAIDMGAAGIHPNRKLTDEQVLEARTLRSLGGWSYAKLAQRYGVTRAAIQLAVYGQTFKHLPSTGGPR